MPLTMRISLIPKLAIIAFLSIITSAWPCFSNFNRTTITCDEEDREGLIKFKQTLQDPHNLLSSWKNGEDCCKWKGVTCHKVTGRVTKLELQSVTMLDDDDWVGSDSFLYSKSSKSCIPLGVGELSSGLASLRYMSHLDLSGIWYTNITVVPPFFGSMKRLKHLHLEGSPCRMKHGYDFNIFVDLQFSPFTNSFIRLVVDDVSWLSHLQSLESLEMGTIQLEKPHEFMEVINNNLSSLSHLRLSYCQLEKSHVSRLNSTFLRHLQYLDLSFNRLDGQIPSAFGNMTSLQHLDLSNNLLDGPIRSAFGNITSLQYLDLSSNSFNSQVIVDVFLTLLKNNQNLKYLRASCSFELKPPHQTGIPFYYNYSAGSIGGNLELLQLDYCKLLGPLPIWFQEMKRLKYLSLKGNSLQWSIPSLPNLKAIDLSHNQLNGTIPSTISRLSALESIYLWYSNLEGSIPESLGTLPNLREVYLSGNRLDGMIPSSFGRLSTLQLLDLSYNNLEGSIPESLGTLPNLREVDLSGNRLDGMIPSSFGQLSTLRLLDLSYNNLEGSIPESLGTLPNLREVDLSDNRLDGMIPSSFGQLSTLQSLVLSHNQLNGTIPINIGQLSNLISLVLRDNSLGGTVSESHFANLSKLYHLELSQNNLTLKVGSNWVPPFQLRHIGLGSCKIEGEFPRWIQTQRIVDTLILSNTRINGPIPKWLSDMQFFALDLSHNNFVEMPSFLFQYLAHLDLSNNLISDHLPLNISEMMPQLESLYLYNNSISGTMPLSLCDMENLSFLDLSKNKLSGSIPNCWRNTSGLWLIDFSSNNFSGVIPKSFLSITNLRSLHLSNNSLFGQFPFPNSLGQWPWLENLDLGENNLFGNLSSSIVMSTNLRILRLRGNKFDGIIPWNFCSLHSLQILDLAANNLTGSIPPCFGNLNAMERRVNGFEERIDTPYLMSPMPKWEVEGVTEIMRGTEIEFTKNTRLLVNLDLSSNHLVGPIPEKLTSLSGLIGLNLSHNSLSGNIPRNIENLTLLESLDLSNNQLSGQIPHGLSSLTALSHLNLANNNLSGHVPQGTQISTIYNENPSLFNGNPFLCGDPLPRKCKADGVEPPQVSKSTTTMGKKEHMSDEFILYIIVALGYTIGFWGIILVLIFKKNWRIACFRYVDEIANKVYVAILVKLAKFQCR